MPRPDARRYGTRRTAWRLLGAAVGFQVLPTATTLAPRRAALWSRLAGIPAVDHVALTFDDGPAHSSSLSLDLPDEHFATARFFMLGAQLDEHRDVVTRMHAAGHEIAVHGWDHRCRARRMPGTRRADPGSDSGQRTADAVRPITA